MSNCEVRTLPNKYAQLRVAQTDTGRTLSGYAAVWDTYSHDLGGFVEVIRRGFFAEAISVNADVVIALNHDMNRLLGRRSVGDVTIEEDEIGLRYTVPLLAGSPTADEVALWAERGMLKGSSFSFIAPADGVTWDWTDLGYPLRRLERGAKLFDLGPATIPAYPRTEDVGQLALRSLAESRGMSLEIVAEAAHRNALGDILNTKLSEQGDVQESGEVVASRAAERARRLKLAEAMVPVR
ncbi:MAG: HK97 family phage prohead protease [Acidimicrobiales bacterium]